MFRGLTSLTFHLMSVIDLVYNKNLVSKLAPFLSNTVFFFFFVYRNNSGITKMEVSKMINLLQ